MEVLSPSAERGDTEMSGSSEAKSSTEVLRLSPGVGGTLMPSPSETVGGTEVLGASLAVGGTLMPGPSDMVGNTGVLRASPERSGTEMPGSSSQKVGGTEVPGPSPRVGCTSGTSSEWGCSEMLSPSETVRCSKAFELLGAVGGTEMLGPSGAVIDTAPFCPGEMAGGWEVPGPSTEVGSSEVFGPSEMMSCPEALEPSEIVGGTEVLGPSRGVCSLEVPGPSEAQRPWTIWGSLRSRGTSGLGAAAGSPLPLLLRALPLPPRRRREFWLTSDMVLSTSVGKLTPTGPRSHRRGRKVLQAPLHRTAASRNAAAAARTPIPSESQEPKLEVVGKKEGSSQQ